MSYLQIPKGIQNFDKAVISFWFRAPKASTLKAVERFTVTENKALTYILPLIVFGKSQQKQDFRYLFGDVLTNPNFSFEHFFALYDWETVGDPYDVGPSYIGLVCYADGTFDLSFNLQMDTYGLYAALDWVAVSATAVRPGGPDSGIDHYDVVLKDTSPTILYGPPEYFFVQTLLSSDPSSGGLDALKPDVWHHLLLSFDLTGSLSIGNPVADSSCRMWYSIDDKDYRGAENLGPNRDAPASDGTGGDGLGPNTILTFNIYKNSGSAFTGEAYGVPVPPPSGSYTPSPVPTSGREFGIPGTSTYVKDILHVEFAEFQMWTDVTLDTDVEANRRAFIDYERDDNGNPIKDKDGNFTLKPVSPVGQPPSTDNPVGVPSPAEELLKKKPEILLHGSSKWIDGENTGATGMDYSTVPPTVKPDGQFKPTGGINKYTPDPSLPESPSSGSRKAGPVRLTVNARL